MKKMEFLRVNMVSLEEEDNEQSQYARENWKTFENYPEINPHSAKHVFFATGMSREQVANEIRQKPLWQNLKIYLKSFTRLEVPLASNLRQESPNILSNPRDKSFHLQTSHQTKSRKS